MEEKNIQVSVDDFGISRVANERILALVLAKKADRVSVMVDGEISREEVEILSLSGVKLDLHLDVERGVPQERKLKEKIVSRVAVFFWYFLSGRYSTKNVEKMWHEQILRFRQLFGRSPDGLNTHQHIHFFPPFFRILMKLTNKHSIRYVRFGKGSSKKWNYIAIILDGLRLLDNSVFRQSGCETSAFLVSADWISDRVLFGGRGGDPEEAVEIIFHPERDEEWNSLAERGYVQRDFLCGFDMSLIFCYHFLYVYFNFYK